MKWQHRLSKRPRGYTTSNRTPLVGYEMSVWYECRLILLIAYEFELCLGARQTFRVRLETFNLSLGATYL